MHWSWYLVLGYWALGAIGWMMVFKWYAKDVDPRFWRMLNAAPYRVWMALLLAAVVAGPLFPLVLVHCAWQGWSAGRRERREWPTAPRQETGVVRNQ